MQKPMKDIVHFFWADLNRLVSMAILFSFIHVFNHIHISNALVCVCIQAC